MTSTPESVPERRRCWFCEASTDPTPPHKYVVARVARECPGRPAASSPDEPQYVGACQVTSTSGVCVLGTAGCITRHIVEAMRSASSPGEASDDRHRNTWDGSCSLCGMGNEYVDQHAPDCPASADEGTPEGCEIDPVSSRGCERGTPGCVTQHADEGARQRPGTARWVCVLTSTGQYDCAEDWPMGNGHEACGWYAPLDAAPPAPSTQPDDAIAAAPPSPAESDTELDRQPRAEFIGSNKARQEVGDPGHCERCCEVGHVAAHPSLGCGDVDCDRYHPVPTTPGKES